MDITYKAGSDLPAGNDIQRQLSIDDGCTGADGEKTQAKRSGPPNRMNDLDYKTWLKFLKSFFRDKSSGEMTSELISFFTKAVWPDGRPSRSLIIGVPGFAQALVQEPRIVECFRDIRSLAGITDILQAACNTGKAYDFILIDLRSYVTDAASV
ncbi:MAG: hypothetical protein ABI670_08945 [Chloroflexota bacterium]